MPGTFGMLASRRMASGMRARHFSSACAPSSASSVANFRSSRILRAILRMTRLSSTTRQCLAPAAAAITALLGDQAGSLKQERKQPIKALTGYENDLGFGGLGGQPGIKTAGQLMR